MSVVVFVVLVFAAALSGRVFQPGAWYDSLKKPTWTPAPWVFPVVWLPLYVMICAAGWLVWDTAGLGVALVLWGIQLVLNAAWSAVFFGLRRMDWAFINVGALWLSIAAFIVVGAQVAVWAGLLFVPYLVWVTIAATLNWKVWRMNADVGDLGPRRSGADAA